MRRYVLLILRWCVSLRRAFFLFVLLTHLLIEVYYGGCKGADASVFWLILCLESSYTTNSWNRSRFIYTLHKQRPPDYITLETTLRDVPISTFMDPITVLMKDVVESLHTSPSLSSDARAVWMSMSICPLPPSSPPMSPVSFPVSVVSQSVSLILFGRYSSPLSGVPDDEDAAMDAPELLSVNDVVSFDIVSSDLVFIPIPKTEIQLIAISPCTIIQTLDTVIEDSYPSIFGHPIFPTSKFPR